MVICLHPKLEVMCVVNAPLLVGSYKAPSKLLSMLKF